MNTLTSKPDGLLPVLFCVHLLGQLGMAEDRPKAPDLREATARSVGLIERTSAEFLRKRECFACHAQTLGALVLSDARTLGYQVDPANLYRLVERVSEVENSLDHGQLRVDTVGHALWTMDIGQWLPGRASGKMTAYLLNAQKAQGYWKATVCRPPAEDSDFTTNYVALRGLNRYGTEEQKDGIATRTAAISAWMSRAKTSSTEDEVFRLRLAKELGSDPKMKNSFIMGLVSKQQVSGGWSQKPGMKPDAYATGSVLVALYDAAGIMPDNPSWNRGLEYLLSTQKSDGSWHVRTRVKPLQEYFESGFPHGKDQFISAFATGWATQALLISVRHAAAGAHQKSSAVEKLNPPPSDDQLPTGRLDR